MKNNGIILFTQDINNEIKKIDTVVNNILELKEILKENIPDKFYIASFGGFLHNFYTGIENIFLRITKRIDKDVPSEISWHKDLLNRMSYDTDFRPHVINEELQKELLEYLNFRHFFRHSYTFELKWEKLKILVDNIDKIYKNLKKDLNKFLKAINKSR